MIRTTREVQIGVLGASISCSVHCRAFCLRSAMGDSVPSLAAFGASLYPLQKANFSWFFCRLSLMSRAAYLPLHLTSLRRAVRAFTVRLLCPLLTSAARSGDHSLLSPDSGTNGRSPEVSSTAFRAQPPDLQPVPLMDMDFAVICPLVRHRMPHIRFLFIGSRLCSTLLSDPASRRRPCASLTLHLHQVE